MPVEVRELIIKATVVSEGNEGVSTAGGAQGSENDASRKEEIIKECVEKVLEILKDKNGR